MASLSKIPVLEVGHGNGLGGSCLSIGRSKVDTSEAIKIAKANCNKSKISTHSIPGLSTFDDIQKAKDNGLDIIRIGANATEIDTCIGQVNFSKKLNLDVWVVFMMPHLIANLNEWKKKIEIISSLGIKKIIIMDSAGVLNPITTSKLISFLSKNYKKISFGFHAHNNFNSAVWNTITAIESGAKIIDATIRGFGAGAGNTQLVVLLTLLYELNINTGIDLKLVYELSEEFPKMFKKKISLPQTTASNILSAKFGLFSGFAPKVHNLSKMLKLNPLESFKAIGEKKLVAGQEDLILNILLNVKKKIK